MTKLDMVQQALHALGEAPPAELSAFIRRHYGVHVPPPVVVIIRATLRDKEMLERFRREAKEAVARATPSAA